MNYYPAPLKLKLHNKYINNPKIFKSRSTQLNFLTLSSLWVPPPHLSPRTQLQQLFLEPNFLSRANLTISVPTRLTPISRASQGGSYSCTAPRPPSFRATCFCRHKVAHGTGTLPTVSHVYRHRPCFLYTGSSRITSLILGN